MKLGEIMYKEAQEKAEKEKKASGETTDKPDEKVKGKKGKKGSKVVDADFEDVTEKDKPDDKKSA